MSDAIVHSKGNRDPSLGYTVFVDGNPQDVSSGKTAKFKMRLETGSALKVDAAATIVSASTTLSGAHTLPTGTLTVASTTGFLERGALLLGGQIVLYSAKTATTFLGCSRGSGTIAGGTAVSQIGGLRYDWAAADVDMADVAAGTAVAEYVGWWEVTTTATGKTQDTLEFPISMVDHLIGSANLCSVADVREALEHSATGRDRDDLIRTHILEASIAIMRETAREFAPQSAAGTARTFRAYPRRMVDGRVVVAFAPYDLQTATAVALHPEQATPETLVDGTDYDLLPVEAELGVYTYLLLAEDKSLSRGRLSSDLLTRFGYAQIRITGTWGFPSVPRDVRRACILTVASWMRRDVAALGVDDFEEVRQLSPPAPSWYTIPPAALRLLRPFRRYQAIF